MNPKIHTRTSPSGKYTLTVTSIETKPGCWNYTTGVVTRGEETIVEVKRNYASFPFLFVEGHANGHDYLVCGENYQGQTVIELDTGRRSDFLPEAATQGHGFCWVAYTYEADAQVLVVDGCIWACPYEYRLYDFSDPMGQGWPEIVLDGDCIESDDKPPTFNPDGTITCYEMREQEDGEENEDGELPKTVVATKTFRRNELKLELVSAWVDEAERKRRAESEAARKRWEDAWEVYKQTDPLYLHVLARVTSEKFDDASYFSTGQCYEGWCPEFKGVDSRICRRLVSSRMTPEGSKVTLDLEWGRNIAPVKLVVYRDGKAAGTLWFERSIAGIDEAFNHSISLLGARS